MKKIKEVDQKTTLKQQVKYIKVKYCYMCLSVNIWYENGVKCQDLLYGHWQLLLISRNKWCVERY